MIDVPVVRTDGKAYGDAGMLTPARLLRRPVLLRSSKSDRTREVERDLGLGDCLYFYVGHACPEFGNGVPTRGWRQAFDEYLGRYFDSPRSYVLGERATSDDPTHRLLRAENGRRAWTWELQLHSDHPVCEHLRMLCVTSAFRDALAMALEEPGVDDEGTWRRFLDAVLLAAPADTEGVGVAQLAERRMAQWL